MPNGIPDQSPPNAGCLDVAKNFQTLPMPFFETSLIRYQTFTTVKTKFLFHFPIEKLITHSWIGGYVQYCEIAVHRDRPGMILNKISIEFVNTVRVPAGKEKNLRTHECESNRSSLLMLKNISTCGFESFC